jgi:hypothetical protein
MEFIKYDQEFPVSDVDMEIVLVLLILSTYNLTPSSCYCSKYKSRSAGQETLSAYQTEGTGLLPCSRLYALVLTEHSHTCY